MQNAAHRMQRALELLRNPELNLRIDLPDFRLLAGISASTFYRRLERGLYAKPEKGPDGRLCYTAAYAREVLTAGAVEASGQPNGEVQS